ncbi:sigma-E processing peptidase SpoIIGA [Desulfitobacterium sp. AusDCA]|uniref:sigma-E processing peptidase SpoIIGA n=1 Tax=Desulfitobacterium sp. AusDCA TaxID=3240383 RepID=UPI003DA76F1F
MMVRYLDLDLMINGIMDLFLLLLTARILNTPPSFYRLLGGVFIGEFPVLLSAFGSVPFLLTLSKFLTPFAMVWVSFTKVGIRTYVKRLTLFWILSVGLGGGVYALWGWVEFDGSSSNALRLGIQNFWVLPLGSLFWWGGQKVSLNWLSNVKKLRASVYDVLIDFGEHSNPIKVKALLDTGNQLRDPLTGTPVLLVEEEIAAAGMPADWQTIIKGSWRNLDDPWPWLWKEDSSWMKTFVFIPYQAVGHKSYLLGIRPQRILLGSSEPQDIQATLALVQHPLSQDGAFQALLHPEHVQGSGG